MIVSSRSAVIDADFSCASYSSRTSYSITNEASNTFAGSSRLFWKRGRYKIAANLSVGSAHF